MPSYPEAVARAATRGFATLLFFRGARMQLKGVCAQKTGVSSFLYLVPRFLRTGTSAAFIFCNDTDMRLDP